MAHKIVLYLMAWLCFLELSLFSSHVVYIYIYALLFVLGVFNVLIFGLPWQVYVCIPIPIIPTWNPVRTWFISKDWVLDMRIVLNYPPLTKEHFPCCRITIRSFLILLGKVIAENTLCCPLEYVLRNYFKSFYQPLIYILLICSILWILPTSLM